VVYIIVSLVALAVTALVLGVTATVASPDRIVRQRLAEIKSGGVPRAAEARKRRQKQREALQGILEALGERVSKDNSAKRAGYIRRLTHEAGYRSPSAPAVFTALRLVSMAGLFAGALSVAALVELSTTMRLCALIAGALLGWMLPFMVLKRKISQRKRALQRGLADALDLMVVCVEAGLGVNQALLRVAEEMDRVSPAISDELTMVTLEMRAGTARDQALKNMADRTGLQDVRAWVNMMVQTDRFGTSIADSLRIHSDTLRTTRKQRAEEAAAKLTVKMLIPLVLFVFPALFVVILGPAVIAFRNFMGN
jgi:tight adherence protein C